MPLSIRDPRAAALAKELARRRGTNMTAAIITALENEIRRDREHETASLSDRLAAIADRMVARTGRQPRLVSKDERDALWGDE